MNHEQYYKHITEYAKKCIAFDPEDPFQYSWNVRDDSITLFDVKDHSYSFVNGYFDIGSTQDIHSPGSELDFALDSAVDYDICKRIRELQESREDAYTTIEQGGVIEWIDGQEFHDYSTWFKATDQRAKDKVAK